MRTGLWQNCSLVGVCLGGLLASAITIAETFPEAGITKEAFSEFKEKKHRPASTPIEKQSPTQTLDEMRTELKGVADKVEERKSAAPVKAQPSPKEEKTPAAELKKLLAVQHAISAFSQQTLDENGTMIDYTSGHFWLKQPNRFRWQIESPYQQLLVSDGTKLVSFDPDLDQAIIQAAEDMIGHSPARLLGQPELLDTLYQVQKKPIEGVGQHFVLNPVGDDVEVESIELEFVEGKFSKLRFIDALGQTTIVTLTEVDLDSPIDDGQFNFVAPQGIEIIDQR